MPPERSSIPPERHIKNLAPRAVEVLEDLLEQPTAEPVRLKAAMEILDRNEATSKLQRIQSTAIVLSGDDARQMMAAWRAGELVSQKYGSKYLVTANKDE